jgi:citrate lyase beta subunit
MSIATNLDLASARTFLFVPASKPERIHKALSSGAEVVIVDLEDAVAPADKDTARKALTVWLDANCDKRVVVRVNAVGTQWHTEDLMACRHVAVAGVVLPKAESLQCMASVHAMTEKPVLPIIETGAGLEFLPQISKAPGCARLLFGKLDLAVELDLLPDETDTAELVFMPYRAMLVLASQRAGLPSPVDGVYTSISDADGLCRYAQRAKSHGFGAVLLIHPAQVAAVLSVYTPSEKDIAWAQSVDLAARNAGGGAAVLEGRMVDAPVMARAQRILVAAGVTSKV